MLNEGELIDSDESSGSDRSGDVTPRGDVTPHRTVDSEPDNAASGNNQLHELPVLQLEAPHKVRSKRSHSLDPSNLLGLYTADSHLYCMDPSNSVKLPSLSETVCSLSDRNKYILEDLEAEDHELIVEYEKKSWHLDDAEKTDPDFEKLNKTDLSELRSMVRDYELHNNALVNLSRELKIELLKVQEQRQHLVSTLKCMTDRSGAID